jgi:hypothetical protein
MITRRSVASLIGAMPFVGPAIAKVSINPPGAGLSSVQSIPQMAGVQMYDTCQGVKVEPIKRLMTEQQAFQLLLKNKDVSDLYTTHLYKEYKNVESIDPDLNVYKSFSTMAKIAYQRQRNVKRRLASLIDEEAGNYLPSKIAKFISKLMWG